MPGRGSAASSTARGSRMFFRRGVSDDDDWLQVKLWLFGVGSILALLGMGFGNDWLIGGAALVLGVGFVLRFIDRRPEDQPEDGSPNDPEPAPPREAP